MGYQAERFSVSCKISVEVTVTSLAPFADSPLPRAAYFHVPFCAHRCGYCDFTLVSGRDDLVGDYLRAIEREMANAKIPPGTSLETLFLGGGTPTHPQPSEMRMLFQRIRQQFQCSPTAEFSVEANPLDLTDEKITLLAEAGVNRISLGVQSFSADALKLLERNHRPDDIAAVMKRLRSRFQNVSLDLIFGVPGQTLADWQETLKRAIDLEPADRKRLEIRERRIAGAEVVHGHGDTRSRQPIDVRLNETSMNWRWNCCRLQDIRNTKFRTLQNRDTNAAITMFIGTGTNTGPSDRVLHAT